MKRAATEPRSRPQPKPKPGTRQVNVRRTSLLCSTQDGQMVRVTLPAEPWADRPERTE